MQQDTLMEEKNDQPIPLVSEKNTKKEIMGAYQELLKRCKGQVSAVSDKKDEQKRAEEQRVLAKVSAFQRGEDVVSSIHQVRTVVHKSLDEIQDKLEKQFDTFSSLQEATRIQEAKLKELYEIEDAAYSLLALLKGTENQKKQFELEKQELQEQRRREEEVYQYELSRKCLEDEEEHRKKQRVFGEEMRGRKEEIAQQEKEWSEKQAEFEELKQKVEAFPERLQVEKDKLRQEVETRLKEEEETKLLIAAKESEAQTSIYKSKLQNLETIIDDQRQQIIGLQQQLQMALKQVQEVTLKTIEGTSNQRTLQAVNKIAMQQAQGGDRDKTAQ